MTNRDRVFLLLSQGQDASSISDQMDLGYSSVLKYKKEYEVAKQEGKLDLILNQDSVLIEQIVSELPGESREIVRKLKGLESLNVNMQQSAELILVKLKTIVSNVGPDDSGDLVACSRILCELQNAFFNKNSVNVNVQNNNFDAGQSTYGEFLNDKPPINL